MSEKVLLTGAGFTYNFGGFLANDIWSIIFNNRAVQSINSLRKRMLKSQEYDFESLYQEVIAGKNNEEKKAMVEAVSKAYQLMDERIKHRGFKEKMSEIDSFSLDSIFSFIKKFSTTSENNGSGYFFTLNQDLFVERLFEHNNELTLMPAMTSIVHKKRFSPTTSYSLPDQEKLNEWLKMHADTYKNRDRPMYIKLHGSYSWRYRDNEDNDIMVIGGNKKKQIAKEPLLKYNFQLFEDCLAKDNIDLMVIGYGFRDRHINNIIIDSIKRGLRLHIINPLPIDTFKRYLCKNNSSTKKRCIGTCLYNAIYGYYNYDLVTLFSGTFKNTNLSYHLLENYFG